MSVPSTQSRVVSPQEARAFSEGLGPDPTLNYALRLAHTVATEPERIARAERAAVVKAFRNYAELLGGSQVAASGLRADAEHIENGADW